jgi:hypothetical protein
MITLPKAFSRIEHTKGAAIEKDGKRRRRDAQSDLGNPRGVEAQLLHNRK